MFRLGRLRVIWFLLVLLAAFVLFIQCLANVGGGADPIPRPTAVPAATAPPVGE